jgi:hypothetical protein
VSSALAIFLLGVGCLEFGGCSSANKKPEVAKAEETETENCRSSREYITVLEYLRGQKAFALSDAESQRVSERVAGLCNGAAVRFITTVNLLVKSTLPTRTALETGVDVARGTTAQSKAFAEIFRKTYLAEYLDLDPQTSLRIAKTLSTDFLGDPEIAARDYSQTIDFCLNRKGLDLTRPYCAELAARIARLGDRYPYGAARLFQDAYDYVSSDSSRAPNRPTAEAVKLAEEITAQGPSGLANFREAYRYAISSGGLQVADHEALVFAKKMTTLSKAQERSRPRALAGK